MSTVLFGIVTDSTDPHGLGRVQVQLPDSGGDATLPWIRVAQPLASKSFGTMLLPEVDDHVVVLQGPGGPNGMVVVGSLYTGKRTPNESNSDGQNNLKQILTRGGNEITLDDSKGSEKVIIQTKNGSVGIEMDATGMKMALAGTVEVSVSSDAKVVVEALNVEVTGKAAVTIKGNASVKVQGAQVEIAGDAKVKISGAAVEIG